MAYGGLGGLSDNYQTPEVMNGTAAAQAAGSTAPAMPPAPLPAVQPTLPAAPPPQQNDGGLPSWEGNPLGRIGFILSSAAAGLQGRELPIVEVRRQQAAQRQQALQTLSATMTLSEHLNEMDPSTANQFLAANQQTLADAGIPLDALKQASSASPEMKANAELLVNGPETYATLASLAGSPDPRKVLKFAETDIGKQIIGSAASDSVLGKHKAFMSALEEGGHGEDLRAAMADKVLTPEEYVHLAGLFPKDSPFYTNLAEKNQILTNEGLQQSLGITPTDVAKSQQNALFANQLQQGNLALEHKYRLSERQAPAAPELIQLQNARDAATDPKRKAEIQALIDKTTTSGGGQQDYVNVMGGDGKVQSYIKGTPEAVAAVKTPGSRVVGATLTGQNVTEAQRRNDSLYSVTATALPVALENFDALTKTGAQILARGGDAGFAMQTPEYQKAENAVKTIVRNYLYSVSGQNATEGEVAAQTSILMPRMGEDPSSVALKKQQLSTYVQAIKMGGSSSASAPDTGVGTATSPPPPATDGSTKKWKIVNGVLVPD